MAMAVDGEGQRLARDHGNVMRCVVCGALIPMFHDDGRKVRWDRLTCSPAHKKERQRWEAMESANFKE